MHKKSELRRIYKACWSVYAKSSSVAH